MNESMCPEEDAVGTANFAPGAATWRTERDIRVVFESDLFPLLCGNMKSSTKPEVGPTCFIALPSEEDRATVRRT